MRKTQIQLPDSLYKRARRFAETREMSLAEVTRRSLELYLDRFPNTPPPAKPWKLPVVDLGGPINISAKKLKEIIEADAVRLPKMR